MPYATRLKKCALLSFAKASFHEARSMEKLKFFDVFHPILIVIHSVRPVSSWEGQHAIRIAALTFWYFSPCRLHNPVDSLAVLVRIHRISASTCTHRECLLLNEPDGQALATNYWEGSLLVWRQGVS